jgi:hypothetical protein
MLAMASLNETAFAEGTARAAQAPPSPSRGELAAPETTQESLDPVAWGIVRAVLGEPGAAPTPGLEPGRLP